MIFFSLWKIWKVLNIGVNHLKTLHQIPCSKCVFFTGDYRLKCTVRPTEALSESAIFCRDFEAKPANSICNAYLNFSKFLEQEKKELLKS